VSESQHVVETHRSIGSVCPALASDETGRGKSTPLRVKASKFQPISNAHVYEREVARRWFALPPGTQLPLSDGDTCRLIFAGLPGSAAGPDVHDAVLLFSEQHYQAVGNIEFHVRASDWYTHAHHSDARYNTVILHIVLVCDNRTPALRQDGSSIPMCSLNDLVLPRTTGVPSLVAASWPCWHIMPQLNAEETTRLLKSAGLLRFEQKAHTFVEALHKSSPAASFSAYDTCLIEALAEALGYGRDRAFFQAAGKYLLGLAKDIPEPLGHTNAPAPLDTRRLTALQKLIAQWHETGAWKSLQGIVATQTLELLQTKFAALGKARTHILICNVILPFAAAVALIEHDDSLYKFAQSHYESYPSLPSNRVTRAMTRQLQLDCEPRGACLQQGLHYIYQQTCKEKCCELCIAGRSAL
jgi:hypothetical protein